MKKIKSQPELNIIGKNIRRYRQAKGLSQKALSERMETLPVYVCRGSLSRIENGARAVTDIEIEAIAKILGVSPNQLFDWPEPPGK